MIFSKIQTKVFRKLELGVVGILYNIVGRMLIVAATPCQWHESALSAL